MDMVISFTVKVTPKQIRDQFCAAFEGGSNYWLQRAELKSCENKPIAKDGVWYGQERIFEGPFVIGLHYDDPRKEEGNGEGFIAITEFDVKLGLSAMAKNNSYQFKILIDGDGDTWTSDSFLQHIVFGKEIYG